MPKESTRRQLTVHLELSQMEYLERLAERHRCSLAQAARAVFAVGRSRPKAVDAVLDPFRDMPAEEGEDG